MDTVEQVKSIAATAVSPASALATPQRPRTELVVLQTETPPVLMVSAVQDTATVVLDPTTVTTAASKVSDLAQAAPAQPLLVLSHQKVLVVVPVTSLA